MKTSRGASRGRASAGERGEKTFMAMKHFASKNKGQTTLIVLHLQPQFKFRQLINTILCHNSYWPSKAAQTVFLPVLGRKI